VDNLNLLCVLRLRVPLTGRNRRRDDSSYSSSGAPNQFYDDLKQHNKKAIHRGRCRFRNDSRSSWPEGRNSTLRSKHSDTRPRPANNINTNILEMHLAACLLLEPPWHDTSLL
jgi:hypothetical protein